MAKGDGQTLEKLYIELGLDLSKLQTDILAADKTVTENLGRLNREKNVIKLRMEADIASLDRVKDAAKILEIQEKALNQQLALQKDRMNILEAAYRQVANNANATAVAVNKAEQAFLREKIAVGQLERQLKALAQGTPAPTNNLLSGYQNLKGNVAGTINEITSALNGLQGASNSVDGALTSVLGIVGRIPPTAAVATAALVGIPLIFKGIENSIVDLARASAASGDSVYVMSRGMQMSVVDAAKFSTNAKIAGVQVNDLATAVKNVQRQVARGGEDSRAAEWLKLYGESAYDASGNLKDLNEMTFALSRALKRAQADGKGAEFVLNAFRNVSADAITAIEDWADVNAQAASIVKAGLANPALAHSVQGNLNAMNVQSAQLGTSFTNALLPVANEIIPRLTERMGKMTLLIRDNKDVILDLGKDFADVWGAVESTIDNVVEGVSVLGKLARQNRVVRNTDTKAVVEKYKDDKTVQNAKDILEREIAAGSYIDEDIARLRSRSDLYSKELKRTEQDLKSLLAERRKAFAEANKPIIDKYKYDDSIKSATILLQKLTDEEKQAIEQTDSVFGSLLERAGVLYLELQNIRKASEGLKKFSNVSEAVVAGAQALGVSEEQKEQLKKAKEYYQEAADIRAKMKYGDYQYQRYALNRWGREKLSQEGLSETERLAIIEDISAKSAQIEQERAEKLKEIRASVAALDKTTLQNKLDIIEKERQEWLNAGMDEAESIELTQKKIAKAYEETNKKIREYAQNAADIEFSLTHTAFEKQIHDIEEWEKAQRDKADTAEEIAGIVAEAAAKEAQAFEREVERIKGLTQSLEDEIFEMEHSQYEADRRRVFQRVQKAISEGVSLSVVGRWANDKFRQLDERARQGGDYIKAPEGAMRRGGNGISVIEGDQIVDDGLKTIAQGIGLLTNENQIRQQLLPQLSREAQERVSAIQMLRNSTDAQKELVPVETQQTSGYQVIEGDEVVSGLQQFSSAFQSVASQIEELNQPISEVEKISATMAQTESYVQETLKRMAESLPVNYFKTLADNTKAVSDMQFGLTKSTMELIDAQSNLRDILKNLPKIDSVIPTSNQQGTNGLINLSAEKRKQLESQASVIPSQHPEMKFGFDWDVFGGFAGLAALIPHPAAKALALGGALGAGAGVGTFNETTAQSTPMTFETIVTPLNNIHTVVSNILSELGNRQPAQITVSLSISNNLGGAYVFDNELKKQLVDDITSDVVDEITQAVTQATSRANYSYGA